MGDRIAVLNMGKLQQVDDPATIYRMPNNMFVATILGNPPMNFLKCSLKWNNGTLNIVHAAFTLSSEDKDVLSLFKAGSKVDGVILGFRPEDIKIHMSKPEIQSIPAEIYVTEPLGNETIVDIKLGDNVIKVLAEPDFAGEPGKKIWISANTHKLHLFNEQSHECVFHATEKSAFSLGA
jgi:multiple sugar transport system ATP-binding protein